MQDNNKQFENFDFTEHGVEEIQNDKDIFKISRESLNKPISPKPNPVKSNEDNDVSHRIRKTKIEWAEFTWNPMVGCTHASEGCLHCYAEAIALRLQEEGVSKYAEGFKARFLPRILNEPKNLLNPTIIFVNSMGDLLHKDFTIEQIKSVIQVIHDTPQHVYICLTKRHLRLAELDREIIWPNNLIMGVTVESNKWVLRADFLRKCGAKHKVISAEPLLEALPDLDLTGIGWLISGGESGPGARPFDPSWAEDLRLLCLKTGTAFFHKQNGGVHKSKTGRKLFGSIYSDYPQVILNMKATRR